MSESSVQVDLRQDHDYQFIVDFGEGLPPLHTDEPAPLGGGTGPSPVRMLATAVGNCLSNSLLFALRKFRQSPEPITTHVQAEVGRNETGRLRVQRMHVRITLGVAGAGLEHLDRALASFEDFCTVTASVRAAFPVTVEVRDAQGVLLKG